MNLKVGQIWKRIDPMSDNFPAKGWKVQITAISEGIVTHRVVEYNGKARTDNLTTSHFIEDFLVVYELEDE